MPDNVPQVQQDLINELLNNLPSGYVEAQVKLPNAPFTTPKNQKWLRPVTNLDPKQNVAVGKVYKRQFGLFTVDVFTPKGSGELEAYTDAQAIAAIYENKNIGAAKCEAASANPINSEETWFRVSLDVSFYFEGY